MKSWVYPPKAATRKIIEWQNVTMNFAGRSVISNITAWLHQGELTCVCGANGAGKTQLMRMALGLVQPSQGKVLLNGADPKTYRHLVGYVPQQKNFNRNFPAAVEDVLVAAIRQSWPLKISSHERELSFQALQRVGGAHLLKKDIGVLSGGEHQRVFIARALINNPEIMVLDEPMAAVDSKGRHGLLDLLKILRETKKTSIVLITHSDAVVSELAERIMFLERGKLVGWGTPEEVLNIAELRDVAFVGHDHEGVIDGAIDSAIDGGEG